MVGFTSYSGPASNFPPKSQWSNFEQIFNVNKPEMLQTGNTGEDVGRIWNAVKQVSKESGIDERVIFCIIMQESTGNVGVRTTWNADGVPTAGLMQASNSPGFPGKHGLTQDQITSMVRHGTNHFKNDLKRFGGGNDAPAIYKALRVYNSGSINENNLSDARGATGHYVSHMANRLCGRRPY
ncbi:hypothetical protein QBC35DRAFT_413757 [Podospora australis]|uniref:Transglycosylase SLT domain-containing protein n=1 Tax=Podospora australis TaxID=1536484 RepID=A0AAN6WQB6_9PEZI|nr:hypothetical protein QBC35DRAFT_413757 [Podospora australis]